MQSPTGPPQQPSSGAYDCAHPVYATLRATCTHIQRQQDYNMGPSHGLWECVDANKGGPSQVMPWGPKDDPASPPYALMEHAPLAILTNGMLAAFNELRHCAPLSLAPAIASLLQVGTMLCTLQCYPSGMVAFLDHPTHAV